MHANPVIKLAKHALDSNLINVMIVLPGMNLNKKPKLVINKNLIFLLHIILYLVLLFF